MQGYVDRDQFSGVVLVARDGKPMLHEAFGLADRTANIANTPETIFAIGSITKQFTAAAVMQLVGMVANGSWVKGPVLPANAFFSAGSLYMSAPDMLKWDQALYGDQIMSPASRAAMLTDSQGDKYGFGIFVEPFEGHVSTSAGGAIPGFVGHIQRLTDDGVTVIVLSNIGDAPIVDISEGLTRLYFGLPTPPIPAIPPMPMKAIGQNTFLTPDAINGRIVFPDVSAGPAQALSFTAIRIRSTRPAPRIDPAALPPWARRSDQ